MVELVIATAAEKLHSEGLKPNEVRSLTPEVQKLLFEDEVDPGGEVVKAAPYEKGDDGLYRRRSQSVRVKLVHASKGKRARAEPVAQLYDEAGIHHVGSFEALETQWTTWDAQSGEESPDRLDAEVWAMTELKLVRVRSGTELADHTRV